MEKLIAGKRRISNYLIVGAIGGAVYGLVEYFLKRNTSDPEVLIPLLLRTFAVGILVFGTAAVFEIFSQTVFIKKPFIYVLLGRSIVYTVIITISLLVVNTAWHLIKTGASLTEELRSYFTGQMYLINVSTVFLCVI
jgi:hypothetical protein